MVDMGFIADIKFLLGLMPTERHSLFFSATISKEIEGLMKSFLRDQHITVSVKSRDTSANVDQDIIRVPSREKKLQVLHELLQRPEFSKVLIFGKTKHGVEKLSVMLSKMGHKVASIHGDKPQSKRQRALDDFKKEKINILVATDVAARGLDIPDVSHVINYDIPMTYEDYIHRIGRTGRANKKGIALTFVE
jgi:superfamily II DNA/RNA helicase